ncbi:uncharacterized protein LOC143881777 [Tasmannia lanceolata]|uniref:uncharacterized protein LOC143881777 n=1 Tax=Tasmannia lanceolata TaxID=3420 RepID=UPI0040632DE9
MDKPNVAKPESSVPKNLNLLMGPKKYEDVEDEDDDESEEDESDDGDILEGEDQSEEDDEDKSSEEEDEATPKKAEPGKKRPAEPAAKTPVHEKKGKLVTPGIQKTGGKNGRRIATPYSATPANREKSKPQTSNPAGTFVCRSCKRLYFSFGAWPFNYKKQCVVCYEKGNIVVMKGKDEELASYRKLVVPERFLSFYFVYSACLIGKG